MHPTQRRARQTARIEKERAMRALARALSMGLGKGTVVVLGDTDVTKSRFYRPRPHRLLLRELARQTNLVIVGEYFSSQKCAFCGRRKECGGDAWIGEGPGGKRGVRTCVHCKTESSRAMYVHRDMNSARCIRDIYYGLLEVRFECWNVMRFECWNVMACISTTSFLTQTCTHIVMHRMEKGLGTIRCHWQSLFIGTSSRGKMAHHYDMGLDYLAHMPLLGRRGALNY